MTRLLTLTLTAALIVLTSDLTAHAANETAQSDVTQQSKSGISSPAYSAFEDPAPFDPSTIEPASGEEIQTTDKSPNTEIPETTSATKGAL
ncbi:MAG: hypothetical protein IAE63_00530 [Alphaproteobacteria bacterium]|nr:hypothetical protein [Alphaproteobacteria bacterium]